MKIFKAILILAILFSGYLYAQDLSIYVVNVQQGDGIIVQTADKTMLIDGGQTNQGGDAIIAKLDSLGISHLNYIVASHYDADHIRAIKKVLESGVTVDSVFDRGSDNPPDTQIYQDYVSAVGDYRATMYPGQILYLSEDVQATCIVVGGKWSETDSLAVTEDNELSIGLLISTDEFRLFTAGDLEGAIEDTAANIVGNVDVLKVSHHGSKFSTSNYFLSKILPEAAVISVGENNSYGHPTAETLGRLDSASSVQIIYQTTEGKGGASEKVSVVGTIPVLVFSDHYSISNDDYNIITQISDEKSLVPSGFSLSQNYPNPFNPSTTIEFSLPNPVNVKISVYNILGQRMIQIYNGQISAGIHQVQWNGRDSFGQKVSSGIYFYRIEAGEFNETKKMVLMQ